MCTGAKTEYMINDLPVPRLFFLPNSVYPLYLLPYHTDAGRGPLDVVEGFCLTVGVASCFGRESCAGQTFFALRGRPGGLVEDSAVSLWRGFLRKLEILRSGTAMWG